MRALKFAKVDFLKAWKHLYILLFPLIAVFILARDPSMPGMFGVAYCLFVSIVIAALPFNSESADESGFLQMLPAKPGEQILGHFLFGLGAVLAGFVLGMLAVAIAHLINPAAPLFQMDGAAVSGFYPALLGVALAFTALEDLLMTLFRFESTHATQLIRIVPGFMFFFAMNFLAESGSGAIGRAMQSVAGGMGFAVLALGLMIFAALAGLACRVAARRGQS